LEGVIEADPVADPVHRSTYTSNRLARVHNLWRFSYTPRAAQLFRGFARCFTTNSVLQTSLLLPQMLRRFSERGVNNKPFKESSRRLRPRNRAPKSAITVGAPA
jgi:hypothetical protein